MEKFKVGDKVIKVSARPGDMIPKGSKGIVTEVVTGSIMVKVPNQNTLQSYSYQWDLLEWDLLEPKLNEWLKRQV